MGKPIKFEVSQPEIKINFQGVAAPPASPQYATRSDIVGNVVYRGESLPGAVETDPEWMVRRITFAEDLQSHVEEWADGNRRMDNIWSNHETLSAQQYAALK